MVSRRAPVPPEGRGALDCVIEAAEIEVAQMLRAARPQPQRLRKGPMGDAAYGPPEVLRQPEFRGHVPRSVVNRAVPRWVWYGGAGCGAPAVWGTAASRA